MATSEEATDTASAPTEIQNEANAPDSSAAAAEAPNEEALSRDAERSAPSQPHPPERVALLTPGGPLLVDVWLTIDARPHTEVFEALIDEVLAAADQDGRPTWKRLVANEEFLAGELAGASAAEDRQMKMWIERFDTNRDGQIQRDEAAAWLGRDAGRRAAPFALRSSRSYFPNPRASSRVWQLLDADGDGRLSADEIAQAPAKLLSLDADDDRVITPAELASLREQLAAVAPTMPVGREATRHAAIHLEPQYNIERLEYVLADLYSPRRSLSPSSFPAFPTLFYMLDTNGDGWLERAELAQLMTIDAHLELSIAFGESDDVEGGAAALEIRDHAPEITFLAQPSADRLVLSLSGTRLIVSAHDLTQRRTTGETTESTQIRLMVHDQCDSLFQELDQNADGMLGEREIASSAARLSAQDATGDGELGIDELPYYMIVAFLRGEPAAEQSFYLPPSEPAPANDPRVPPWFVHADFNGDGEVSRREFLGTAEQFARLDANGDGYISAEEAIAIAAASADE